jgi:hypothetical protein
MRILLAGALGAIAVSLSGCGEGSAFDNGVRSSFRENAVQSCVTASRGAPDSSRFDWPRLCGCAIDRYMAGKSTSDLRNADPHDPALRAATQQCAMDQVGAAAGAPPAGEPTGETGNEAKPTD